MIHTSHYYKSRVDYTHYLCLTVRRKDVALVKGVSSRPLGVGAKDENNFTVERWFEEVPKSFTDTFDKITTTGTYTTD